MDLTTLSSLFWTLFFTCFADAAFEAPVVVVTLEQRGAELICGSENIYPKPTVTWTSSPEPLTSCTSSETGLFTVNSSVPLTQRPPLEHSCNVSTEHDWRSATYRRNSDIAASDSVTVPCPEPAAPVKRLLWSFNHKGVIFKKTGSEPVLSESWRPFVDGLTKSNSLVLKDLTQDQLGLFSCELSTESEEFIIDTEVTEVTEALAVGAEPSDPDLRVLEWMAVALFFMCAIVLVIYRCTEKNPTFKTLVNRLKDVTSVTQRRKSPDHRESEHES